MEKNQGTEPKRSDFHESLSWFISDSKNSQLITSLLVSWHCVLGWLSYLMSGSSGLCEFISDNF